jgi:hypothetical protein
LPYIVAFGGRETAFIFRIAFEKAHELRFFYCFLEEPVPAGHLNFYNFMSQR